MIVRNNHNRGLIKMIIVIFIVLLVLAYFGLNLRSIVGSQTFQDNWNFLATLIGNIWTTVLRGPVIWLWNTAIAPLIFKTATHIQDQQQLATSTLSFASSTFSGM